MSDKTNGNGHQNGNGNGHSNGHGLVRTQNDVPPTVSFARNALAKDALYRELVEVLWRRKWIILSIVLLCLGYAYYEINHMTPIFTSTTRVYIMQNRQKILEVEGLQNGSSANSFMNVQVDRIKSSRIAAATLELLKHTKGKDAPKPLWAADGWAALDMDPKAVAGFYDRKLKTFEKSGNPVGQLKGMLTVDIGKNDDNLEITCESPYPDEAALIVNKVVEAYKEDDVAMRQTGANNIVAQLRTEKDKLETKLLEKQTELAKLQEAIAKETNNLFLPGDNNKNNPLADRLQILATQSTEASIKTVRARSMWVSAQGKRDNPDALEKMLQASNSSGNAVIQPTSELAQARIALQDIDGALAHARATMAPKNLFIVSLEAQRAEAVQIVDRLKQHAAETYLGIIEQNFIQAESNESDLKGQYEKQVLLVSKANKGQVDCDALNNEIQRSEKLSDMLDDRIKQINVTQDVGAPTINVLEEAQVPFFPSKPQKSKLMGIAMAVGMFLGVGSAFLLDWMDHRIRTPDDIRAIVQLPILGLVPHVSRRTAFAQLGQAVHLQPRSAVAESFRTVRMAVHFSGIERSCQKILVTSAVLGDGKTVTASNLAIAIAQAGQRAVIVDADFHRPRQHLIFGTPNEAGLSNVLQGQCPLEDVVLTTPIPRVDILPCGPLPANPYELLNSKSFNEIFEVLKQHYDHIIIDSPPVLAVADALVLAAMCDATVLVARMHRSRRQAFEEAVASLAQVGTRVLGVVVNDMRGGKERYSLYRTHYSTRSSRMEAFDPTRLLGSRKDS